MVALVDDIIMNTTQPPFDNRKVRQAVNLAINRPRFVQNYYQGFSEPICLPYPKSSPAYFADQAKTCEYSLDKAAALLKEASMTNSTHHPDNSKGNPGGAMLAQIMQARPAADMA